ncbi:hypothetical protein ABVB30_07225 [Staphylococcus cohnii]
MTLKNSLRFGIIMALVMCTMFYIFPMPETLVWRILFCLIIVGVGLLLSYFILGKENMKKSSTLIVLKFTTLLIKIAWFYY